MCVVVFALSDLNHLTQEIPNVETLEQLVGLVAEREDVVHAMHETDLAAHQTRQVSSLI